GAEPLQCSSGDLIEYLKGGSGSSFTGGNNWTVNPNPNDPTGPSLPFDLEYKINDADWCEGIANTSTPAWRGSFNIGSGNGIKDKNIYTGIPAGTTEFNLTCGRNSNNYNLKAAVSKNEIELVQMYELILNVALRDNKVFAWNILTNEIRLIEMEEKIILPTKFKLMLRQVGSEIIFVPSSEGFSVPGGFIETNPKYSTMLTLSANSKQVTLNDINNNSELPLALQEKNCSMY